MRQSHGLKKSPVYTRGPSVDARNTALALLRYPARETCRFDWRVCYKRHARAHANHSESSVAPCVASPLPSLVPPLCLPRRRSVADDRMPPRRRSASGNRVVRARPSGRFDAEIRSEEERIHLGTFDTAHEAARAYEAVA
nr:APETALA2-like protein 1 [Lolium perenne]